MQNVRTISRSIKSGGIRETEARPFVHVLADSSDKLSAVCSLLDQNFSVAGERLDAEAKLSQVPFAVVVRADLRDVGNIAAIKKRASKLAKAQRRIFLVEYSSHLSISQAYALGATHVLPGTRSTRASCGPHWLIEPRRRLHPAPRRRRTTPPRPRQPPSHRCSRP